MWPIGSFIYRDPNVIARQHKKVWFVYKLISYTELGGYICIEFPGARVTSGSDPHDILIERQFINGDKNDLIRLRLNDLIDVQVFEAAMKYEP